MSRLLWPLAFVQVLAAGALVSVSTTRPVSDTGHPEPVTPAPEPERTVFVDTNGNLHLYGHRVEWTWKPKQKVPAELSARCKASIREYPEAFQSERTGHVLREVVICFDDDSLATEIFGPTKGRQ